MVLHIGTGAGLSLLGFILFILLCFYFFSDHGGNGDRELVDPKQVNLNRPQNQRVVYEVSKEYYKQMTHEEQRRQQQLAELDQENQEPPDMSEYR
jgi:hypothetical protein